MLECFRQKWLAFQAKGGGSGHQELIFQTDLRQLRVTIMAPVAAMENCTCGVYALLNRGVYEKVLCHADHPHLTLI